MPVATKTKNRYGAFGSNERNWVCPVNRTPHQAVGAGRHIHPLRSQEAVTLVLLAGFTD